MIISTMVIMIVVTYEVNYVTSLNTFFYTGNSSFKISYGKLSSYHSKRLSLYT